jgi:hypothetical protein
MIIFLSAPKKKNKVKKERKIHVRPNIDPPGKGQEGASLEVKPARLALFFLLRKNDYLKKI